MADISYSVTKAAANRSDSPTGSNASPDVVVGTASPGTGDIELRINQTSNKVKRKDVILALERFHKKLISSNTPDFEGAGTP